MRFAEWLLKLFVVCLPFELRKLHSSLLNTKHSYLLRSYFTSPHQIHAFKLGYIATAWDLVALCAVIDEELCLITPHVTQDTEAMLLYSTTTAPTIASMLMPTAARECSRLLLIYADIYVSNAAEWPGRMRSKMLADIQLEHY